MSGGSKSSQVAHNRKVGRRGRDTYKGKPKAFHPEIGKCTCFQLSGRDPCPVHHR